MAYLLVDVELAEDFGSIEKMGVVNDPVVSGQSRSMECACEGAAVDSLLLGVPGEQRQVENKRQPVAVDEEQEGEEAVDGSFGDNVGVETVAQVNGVDVVAKRKRHRVSLGLERESTRGATADNCLGELSKANYGRWRRHTTPNHCT